MILPLSPYQKPWKPMAFFVASKVSIFEANGVPMTMPHSLQTMPPT